MLLAAAATAAADRTGRSSLSTLSSSSLKACKLNPPMEAVVSERSSSLMICSTRLTILPTASSAIHTEF